MPTTFSLAPTETTDMLTTIMRLYHDNLVLAGVTVGVLMAENPDGPGIMHGGYPALAKVKPVSLKDRALGKPDVELIIDLRGWNGLTNERMMAILDHEMSHLQLKAEPKPGKWRMLPGQTLDEVAGGWWKLDDLGRPVVKSKPGDWNAGDGFASVCERHGQNAQELVNLVRCHGKAKAAAALFDNSKPGPASEKVKRERNK